MVKIKKESTMSLDELIKWAKENNITSKDYKNNFGDIVSFDMFGDISVSDCFNIDSNISVEIEEEITEGTKLEVILELYYNTYSGEVCSTIHRNRSINEILTNNQDEFKTKCLYLVQEDMSMSLIYMNVCDSKGGINND